MSEQSREEKFPNRAKQVSNAELIRATENSNQEELHPKNKFLKTAELRDLENQVTEGQISYSRMVEILNEKAAQHFYSSEEQDKEVKEVIITDKEIKDYAWQWAEDNNGHGVDKYFADCNFQCGARWMRDKLSTPPLPEGELNKMAEEAFKPFKGVSDLNNNKNNQTMFTQGFILGYISKQ